MKGLETMNEGVLMPTVRDYVRRAAGFDEDIRLLFGGDSQQLREYRSMTARYQEVWEGLGSNRGLSIPAFALIGETKTGKTTLARLLSGKDLSAKGGPTETADRIRWIGPMKPATLDPDWEECEVVDAGSMINLGTPYLIIDTPRLETLCKNSEVCFHKVFSSTRFKIVVLEQEKLEREIWLNRVSSYRGSVVLPVIRLSPESTKGYPENHASLVEAWRKDYEPGIGAKLAGINLEPPVFLPHLDAMGDRDKSIALVREVLAERLRNLLQEYQGGSSDRYAELNASWEHFLNVLKPMLSAIGSVLLTERHDEFQKAVAQLPEQIVEHLLSDKRRLRALMRMDLREGLMDCIPGWVFPFRTLVSLLCLTNGAWDRLILAAAGSIPSAFLTMAGAARRKTDEAKAERSLRDGMDGRLQVLVRAKLARPWKGFVAALGKARDSADTEDMHGCDFEIEGSEQLAEFWRQAQADATQLSNPDNRRWVSLISMAGALVFWILFMGPLAQAYGQYVPAVFRSLAGVWTAENLATYPAPGAAFWFSSFILSLIPAFLVALILVAVRIGDRRVKYCMTRLEERMKEHLTQSTLGLRIRPTNPRVTAYRNLASLIAAQSE